MDVSPNGEKETEFKHPKLKPMRMVLDHSGQLSYGLKQKRSDYSSDLSRSSPNGWKLQPNHALVEP